MGLPGADAWELAGFPGRLKVAAYLTADQVAAQYRVLVDALLDAQEHSLTGVGRDELLAAVRERIAAATDAETAERLTSPDVFDLDARMKALQDWDVVIRWQDKAKTEADFIRTRDRFQLTSEAADLHRWLRRKVDEDAVATSAAAFAPAIIADRLDETIGTLGNRDHARAAHAWAQVRTTLKDMAEAASIWQSRMASALAGSPDEEKMRRLRETLLAYVTVWGAGVDSYSPRIRASIGQAGLAEMTRQYLPDYDTARLRQGAGLRTTAANRAAELIGAHEIATKTLATAVEQANAARERLGIAQRLAAEREAAVENSINAVGQSLSGWAHALDERIRPSAELVENWSQQVAELTEAPEPGPLLVTAINRDHLIPARRPQEERRAELESALTANDKELSTVQKEIDSAEAERDPRPRDPEFWVRRQRPEGMAADGARSGV